MKPSQSPARARAPPEPPFSLLSLEEKADPAFAVPEEFARAIEDSPLRGLLNGTSSPHWWKGIAETDRQYPWVHVSEQLRAAGRWLEANRHKPKKRLTAFVTNWLNREIKAGIAHGLPEARTFA